MRNMTPSLWIIPCLEEKGNKFNDRLVLKGDSSSLVCFIAAWLSPLLPGSSGWQAPNRKVVEKIAFSLAINKASKMTHVFVFLHLVVLIFEYSKILWRFTGRTNCA